MSIVNLGQKRLSEIGLLYGGYIYIGVYVAAKLQANLHQTVFFILHLTTGFILLEITIKMINKFSFTSAPSLLFVLINSLYYILSSSKYFAGLEFYPQFSIRAEERFFGSIAVWCVLILCLILIKFISSKWGKIINERDLFKRNVITRTLFFFLITDIFIKALLARSGYGPYYWSTILPYKMLSYSGLVFLNLESIFGDIVSILSALLIAMPRHRRSVISMILAIIGLGTQLTWAIFMKSRTYFLIPIILVCTCVFLIRGKNLASKLWRWLAFLAFAINIIGAASIISILGRPNYLGETNSLYSSVAQIGYRADLSDFAVAYLKHRQTSGPNFALIGEAAQNAIPRALWPYKDFERQYEILFIQMGWLPVDYPDTFFSSGALLAGWLGFILVPLCFVTYIELGSRLVLRFLKHYGGSVVFILSYLYILGSLYRIEMDWNLFFLYYVRSPLIAFFLIFIVNLIIKAIKATIKLYSTKKRYQGSL